MTTDTPLERKDYVFIILCIVILLGIIFLMLAPVLFENASSDSLGTSRVSVWFSLLFMLPIVPVPIIVLSSIYKADKMKSYIPIEKGKELLFTSFLITMLLFVFIVMLTDSMSPTLIFRLFLIIIVYSVFALALPNLLVFSRLKKHRDWISHSGVFSRENIKDIHNKAKKIIEEFADKEHAVNKIKKYLLPKGYKVTIEEKYIIQFTKPMIFGKDIINIDLEPPSDSESDIEYSPIEVMDENNPDSVKEDQNSREDYVEKRLDEIKDALDLYANMSKK